MNETEQQPIWSWPSLGLTITKLSESAYRLTDSDKSVATFSDFEKALAYAHAEFIIE